MFLFIGFIIIIFLLSLIYIISRFRKFEFIKNSKYTNLICLGIVLVFIILYLFLNLTIVIYFMHLALFFLIGDFVYYIIKKSNKFWCKYYIIGLISILFTTVYIGYAYINMKNIHETNYVINSFKNKETINLTFVTDLHIGTSFNNNELQKYLNKYVINPDVLLIGGDFVDERTTYKEMQEACKILGEVKTKYGIYFIFGNHDLNIYNNEREYSDKELILELNKNNIHILDDKVELINNNFYLIGRKDKTSMNRLSIFELTKDLNKKKLMIVLDHQPSDYENAYLSDVDLWISGHTHGGQLFPIKYISEISKVNDLTYGMLKKNNTTFIVSSGLGGWGIPLRTNSISEIVNITIN